MMFSPIIKYVVMLSYWIVTIVALNLGLIPVLGYNVLENILGKMGLESIFMPIHYVVGVAGLVALWMLLMGHKCCCDKCRCGE